MRCKSQDNNWKWWFALIPFKLDREWVWLEWYQYRFEDLYYAIRLKDKFGIK
jgi:hypothetical protein